MIATNMEQRGAKGKALASGLLLLALMVACLLLTATPAHAATFTVNSVGDAGDNNPGDGSCFTGVLIVGSGPGLVEECTLRAAIEETNANNNDATVVDAIGFNIPGAGPHTISPGTTNLPIISEPVVIDGYTQPGAKPNTLAVGNDAVLKIELSGAASLSGNGLQISASNSTVRGLVINRWSSGVFIVGPAASRQIVGNYIGTDASGTQDLGNGFGVFISGVPNNTVGGTTAAARNIISGNTQYGVVIFNPGATGNKVMGNYVGTDKNGTAVLGNSEDGVIVAGAPNNTIGGTTAGERNVISGNGNNGVRIESGDATGNEVLGNYVGTDASGTQALGNSGSGMSIDGASRNTIGGTTAGARNIISGNSSDGVAISGNARGVNLISNSIFSNGALGIDLLNDNVPNLNDPDDADGGPNGMQNYPVITSATTSGGTTTIEGTLNSIPNGSFTLQFFASPAPDPSGFGEGKTFLGQTNVTVNAAGNALFNFTTATPLAGGQVVTATATATDTVIGDTSEFSEAVKLVDNTPPPPPPPPSNTAPEITANVPAKTRDKTPTVTATVTDGETDLSSEKIQLFMDNQAVTGFAYDAATGKLSFTSKKLKKGSHTLRIEATDGKLSSSESFTFKVKKKKKNNNR